MNHVGTVTYRMDTFGCEEVGLVRLDIVLVPFHTLMRASGPKHIPELVRFGEDEILSLWRRLDEKEPMPVPCCLYTASRQRCPRYIAHDSHAFQPMTHKSHVGVLVHPQCRCNVEQHHLFHLVRVIQC